MDGLIDLRALWNEALRDNVMNLDEARALKAKSDQVMRQTGLLCQTVAFAGTVLGAAGGIEGRGVTDKIAVIKRTMNMVEMHPELDSAA